MRAGAPAVEHLSVEDRAARGKAARTDVGRERSRRLGARDGPAGSRRAAGGTGGDAPAAAGAHPLRPHARVAVHLLPRRRRPHGLGPRERAAHRAGRAAVRRRAPVELRRLRRTGPADGLQHQRLRRDASGAVRVGREAARRKLRRRRARPRIRRQATPRDQPGGGPRVPQRDGGLRRHAHDGALVHPARHRRDRRALGVSREGQAAQALRAQRGEGAYEGQPARARQAHAPGRRRAADRERPAAHRADRGHGGARGARAGRSVHARDHPLVSPNPVGRSPEPAGALPLRPFRAQGRRGGKRRDARMDHPAARPRQRGPAAAAGQGGRGLGARAGARRQRVRQPRPARRRGPAADAGRERHHARLAEPRGSARRQARLLHPPAVGCQGLGARRGDGAACHDGSTPTSAAGRSLARTRARAIQSPSRAISAAATPSTARSPPSRRPTRSRTSATTTRWRGAAASGRIAVETGL